MPTPSDVHVVGFSDLCINALLPSRLGATVTSWWPILSQSPGWWCPGWSSLKAMWSTSSTPCSSSLLSESSLAASSVHLPQISNIIEQYSIDRRGKYFRNRNVQIRLHSVKKIHSILIKLHTILQNKLFIFQMLQLFSPYPFQDLDVSNNFVPVSFTIIHNEMFDFVSQIRQWETWERGGEKNKTLTEMMLTLRTGNISGPHEGWCWSSSPEFRIWQLTDIHYRSSRNIRLHIPKYWSGKKEWITFVKEFEIYRYLKYKSDSASALSLFSSDKNSR